VLCIERFRDFIFSLEISNFQTALSTVCVLSTGLSKINLSLN
jgi:hypothetical protein